MLRWSTQIHKWLGLVVGLQVLGWVLGGLVMTAIPIQTVRSEHHVAKFRPDPLPDAGLVAYGAAAAGLGVEPVEATLKSTLRGPVWVLKDGEGRTHVVDARTGRQIVSRDFPRYTGVLDVDGGRAVLFSMAPARTLWWNFVADTTRPILRRGAGAADIGADRLSTFTGDPYQGGCTVVSSLRRPRQVLWRSCEDRPIAFSPNGRRMVTTDILSDGLGPGEVTARTTKGGKRLAAYRAYWFGAIAWETDRALLMDANTRRRAATVRCVVAECERASAVRRP